MRDPGADMERDAYDSKGKIDHRASPRPNLLNDSWKGRVKSLDGMLASSSLKKVNSVALCYLVLLLLVVGLAVQDHVRQNYKLRRLARSSKQWEALYSQSLDEIVDWTKKVEAEKKRAAESAKNFDLLEVTLKQVRDENYGKTEELGRLQSDMASKDKQREQLARKLEQTEQESQIQLQEIKQEIQVKKLELEATLREREELKQTTGRHANTIALINGENQKLSGRLKELEAAALASKKKAGEAEGLLQTLRDELKNATRHSNYLEEHVSNLTAKNKVLEKESRSKLDSTAKQMKDQVDAANSRTEAAQGEKRALEGHVAELESRLERSLSRIAELEEAAKSADASRERLQAEVRDKDQRLQQAEFNRVAELEEGRKRREAQEQAETDRKVAETERKEGEERAETERKAAETERKEAERKTAEAEEAQLWAEAEQRKAETERTRAEEKGQQAEDMIKQRQEEVAKLDQTASDGEAGKAGVLQLVQTEGGSADQSL